jgi:hypothetical protein
MRTSSASASFFVPWMVAYFYRILFVCGSRPAYNVMLYVSFARLRMYPRTDVLLRGRLMAKTTQATGGRDRQ